MAVNDDRSGDYAGIDGAAVDASDYVLSALGRGDLPTSADPAENELLALLADFRADIDAEPLPDLPSEQRIAEAVAPNVTQLRPRRGWVPDGEHHHGSRPALWQAVTGAAAVAAVLCGGLSIAAHNSAPGDPLWDINKSIFAEHADRVELVSQLADSLSQADVAAKTGDRETAERILNEVSSQLDQVGDNEERVHLIQVRDSIERDLSRVTPTSVPLPEPSNQPAPESLPTPAPAAPSQTLVPVIPDLTSLALTPSMAPPLPVIPVPLDGLNISSTLHIPIDTSRLQEFLSTSTKGPSTVPETTVPTTTTGTRTSSVPTTSPGRPAPTEVPIPRSRNAGGN